MWPFSCKRIEPEYYRVFGPLYPHVLYKYDPKTRQWWYWIERDQAWRWFKQEQKGHPFKSHGDKECLRDILPKASKLEVLLIWGPEAVKGWV